MDNSPIDTTTTSRQPRHYATIGIDDVFLEPPNHPFPKTYYCLSQNNTNGGNDDDDTTITQSFLSSEIVGVLKDSAEDFVVREIAREGRAIPGRVTDDVERTAFRVADIVDIQNEEEIILHSSREQNNKIAKSESAHTDSTKDKTGKESDPNRVAGSTIESNPSIPEKAAMPAQVAPITLLKTVLQEILKDDRSPEDIFECCQSLEKNAVQRMKEADSHTSPKDALDTHVLFPPIPSDFSNLKNREGLAGIDRRAFHEAFRRMYPLLKCETDHDQMKISADDFFDDLIPFLYNPQEDLPILYKFQKQGFTAASISENNRHRHQRGRSGKRKRDRDDSENLGVVTVPILRLKPDLSKDDRRPIHRLIAQKNRAFQTNTLSNHPLEADNIEKGVCNAIEIYWDSRAIKRLKKAKPNKDCDNANISEASDQTPNTLCVVKKREKEHLTTITHLCSALKCRTSDVGMAGIKDMKAITYQYCTLRNVGLERLRRARPMLEGKGIEIGTMRKVGFMLQNGDLQGNRFRIVIRNVKRVYVQKVKSGIPVEEFCSCEKEHLQEMFERIQRSGFVNFYGEQRVGTPGERAEVGVRTFDVGRAMLQGNFSEAIDLLMIGRTISYSRDESENPCEARVRQAWKESNGDPAATLKAFPKGENLPRERAVLQGLKRYGKSEPLAAIQCLPYNVRKFWINAYQSWIWNVMASTRLRIHGTLPVVGDLFLEEGATNKNDVKVVNEANLSSVSISQVVLPLPGYDVRYPENEIGDTYKRLLAEENISFDKKGPTEGTAKGAYRNLVAKADNMAMTFEDKSDNLRSASSACISFDLPSGCYATMLLRELMYKTVARD